MMYLSDIPTLTTRTKNILKKNNLVTCKDMHNYTPRKYYDFREFRTLSAAINSKSICAVKGVVEKYKTKEEPYRPIVISLYLRVPLNNTSEERLRVTLFGRQDIKANLKNMKKQEYVVLGTFIHDKYGYSCKTCIDIAEGKYFKNKIETVYLHHKGLSDEMRANILEYAILNDSTEFLPSWMIKELKTDNYITALRKVHYPEDMFGIEEGKRRLVINDLCYYSYKLIEDQKNRVLKSNKTISTRDYYKKLQSVIPFTLTETQQSVINRVLDKLAAGNLLNDILCGDVGTGKSMVIFAIMLVMAENGYQSVLMAPTTILANQHYDELASCAEKIGVSVALLTSDTKKSEKTKLCKAIKAGEISIIIGTQSVISSTVEYNSLGLVVTDEEHRFGVEQKSSLAKREKLHILSVSATPIPKTLASSIFLGREVHKLEAPKSKGNIKTAVTKSDVKAKEFILSEIRKGHQAYVICPRIEDDEDSEMTLHSVDVVTKEYKQLLAPYGYKVGQITGQTSQKDFQSTYEDFKNNELQVLVATTVVEVGVNVPNSTVILIYDAERYGLAQLHQLRGRVGRGSADGYCIALYNTEKCPERLEVFHSTKDGERIAEEDMRIRGTGDLFGVEQSGYNTFLDYAIRYNVLFKKIVELMKGKEHEFENIVNFYEAV